jgi:hypothetical protein
MPYFIYKITSDEASGAKQLDMLREHDNFKSAKQEVRAMRQARESGDDAIYKVIFAADPPEAERRLLEHREQPIIKEWEK